MPTCLTKYYGEMEYSEEAVLNFPLGLFGFETETRFLLIENPAVRPIVFLQSLSTPQLCFLTLPVFVVDQGYKLAISADDLALLELPAGRQPRIGEDVACLAIISVQENKPTTANLLAPVVVSLRSNKAAQTISEESSYSHQYVFLEPRQEAVCS